MSSDLMRRPSAGKDESTLRQTVYSVQKDVEKNVEKDDGKDVEKNVEKNVGINGEKEFNLDSILDRIGHFGRFQTIVFLLICLPMAFNAINSVAYVFTASTVVHRCNITECDTTASQYYEPWTDFTIPSKGNELGRCFRYSGIDDNATWPDHENVCYPQNFDRHKTERCRTDNLIFRNTEVTIANDFGIFCADEWKLSLVGSINNVGQFIGIPLGGFISDKYGRSTSLALGGFLGAIFGIIRSLSPNYLFFMVFEFLDSLSSSTLYPTCFIVGIELVGPKRRVIACSMITICYAVGEILLALIAKYYQNWRVLLRILYIPALVHFAYFWILPESVRWLLSQQQEDRAKAILKRAATFNKRKLSDHSLEKLVRDNRNKLQSVNESKFPIKKAFHTFFWRIANCSFCWIVNVLVYFGLSVNSVLLGGDKYNNFMFTALVEIPGFLLPYLIMDRIGRRFSLFLLMLVSGICCLGTVFTGPDDYYLELSCFLTGKLAITASFQVLYFFTSEIFPTCLRNSLLSFCSMVGRFGSMIAPLTPLLAKYNESAPALLFSCAALISAFLALLFPETTNSILPTTFQEADDIGDKKKDESS